jgi:hypothetical protein
MNIIIGCEDGWRLKLSGVRWALHNKDWLLVFSVETPPTGTMKSSLYVLSLYV